MNCPKCKHRKTDVYNSRDSVEGTRRSRKCAECGHRWQTIETVTEPRRRGRLPGQGEAHWEMDQSKLAEIRKQKERAELRDDEPDDDDSITPN